MILTISNIETDKLSKINPQFTMNKPQLIHVEKVRYWKLPMMQIVQKL
jgi:hypothetical protein